MKKGQILTYGNYQSATAVLRQTDVSYLEELLLEPGGAMRTVPFESIRFIPQNDLSAFCHKHGIYQIVTTELVDFVREQLEGYTAIEIGAGNGCLGRALGVPATDSFVQEQAEMRIFLTAQKQPPVRYGADVHRLEALSAVRFFGADAAVGAWVTHKFKHHSPGGFYKGVDEAILSKRIKRYVFIGNLGSHAGKEMLRYSKPVEYRFDWLVSRSLNREQNMIWVFDFNN